MSNRYLILMRHATAAPSLAHGNDASRNLTPSGVREAQNAAGLLNKLVRHASIVASPIQRAQQTALIISDVIQSQVASDKRLDTSSSVVDAVDCIREQLLLTTQHLLVVAHMPTIADVTSTIISVPSATISFVPSTFVVITISSDRKPSGALVGVFPPEIVSALL